MPAIRQQGIFLFISIMYYGLWMIPPPLFLASIISSYKRLINENTRESNSNIQLICHLPYKQHITQARKQLSDHLSPTRLESHLSIKLKMFPQVPSFLSSRAPRLQPSLSLPSTSPPPYLSLASVPLACLPSPCPLLILSSTRLCVAGPRRQAPICYQSLRPRACVAGNLAYNGQFGRLQSVDMPLSRLKLPCQPDPLHFDLYLTSIFLLLSSCCPRCMIL